MPIAIVNAHGTIPAPQTPATFLSQLAALPDDAPVVIMLHGYRYSPSHQRASPHHFILSPTGQRGRTRSWPRRMGFGQRWAQSGLCIAFGWEADGTLWQAYKEAANASLALSQLILTVQSIHPGPVSIIAHSLGARVALGALPHLPARAVARMVLLAGAEFQSTATAALETPAGRTTEVLNVTSRENDIYDFLFERLLAPLSLRARSIGAGLALPNAVTLQIDCPAHRSALRALGYPTAEPARLMCHWSAYTRPGMFPFYRAFLRRPASLPLAILRHTLPTTIAPRWSRLRIIPLPRPGIAVQ